MNVLSDPTVLASLIAVGVILVGLVFTYFVVKDKLG